MKVINEKHGEGYAAYNADCVEFAKNLPDESIDLSVYSPPFANLYTYSDSVADMGNCDNDAQFFEQYKYLIEEKLRITKPGRLSCVHCCDLPTSKGKDGYIVSHVKTLHTVIYCKTDNLGSFFCVSCGVDITLKPQWAYLRNSEKRSSRPKTIRRDIHCNRCYDRYEIMRFDHTVDVGGGRKTIGGALSWRIKDRFRHWAGEEE